MKERIIWVDTLKGFAMILVMMGHTYFSSEIKTWLYTFHVPLFFFLAGYVFSIKKYKSFQSFLGSKIKTLMFPAVILGLSVCVFDELIKRPSAGEFFGEMAKRIAGVFIQLRGSSFDIKCWFIICLFVTEIELYFLLKLTKNNAKVIIGILCTCSLIGYGYVKIIDHICPWSIEASWIAIGFFGAGYLIRNYGDKIICMFSTFRAVIVFGVVNIFYTLFILQNGKGLDIYSDHLGPYPFTYVGVFSGILLCLGIFQKLPKIGILTYIGKNSFIYYVLHKSVFELISMLFSVMKIDLSNIEIDIKGMIYLCLGSAIIALIAYGINHYAPWIMGREMKGMEEKEEKSVRV